MSDWMLYHAFGIRGYEIVRQEKFDRRCLSFSLRATSQVLRCPAGSSVAESVVCPSAENLPQDRKIRSGKENGPIRHGGWRRGR